MKKTSIRMIFSLFLLTANTVVFTGYMIYCYQTAKAEMAYELKDTAAYMAKWLSGGLRMPVWSMDKKTTEDIITSGMSRQVWAVIVRDEGNKIFCGMKRDESWQIVSCNKKFDEAEEKGDLVTAEADIVDKKLRLGGVKVYLTSRFMEEKLKDSIISMLLALLILNLIIFLLLYFFVETVIINSIGTIVSYISRLSVGDIPEIIEKKYVGEFNRIKDSLNLLIETTLETTRISNEIAAGNISITVTERSEKDQMMGALNRMIQRLNDIMKETNGMIQSVEQGKLDVRGNTETFEGGWYDLVKGVNHLIERLSDTVSRSAALSQEMELARKIQTSLLPDSVNNLHPDMEIAAAMLPAEQVGGDFYDVAYDRTGNLWLAVGDVSGHGVTPGLIMMMAQTVHTTVTANLECDARDIVIKINEILYMNVHERLKENHFMTFTALKYLGKGCFQHAGAHLSMIVFRQKTGTCELIRTSGIYLNFKKDISKPTKNSEFSLDPGDTLVLYTDGLTESENPDGKMLDLEGFVKIVEKHVSREPEGMKDMIMKDVIQWCNDRRADDMTLVIVRRKSEAC
jgi:serine phosphatase RsbU (regulator of sigma subunit)